MNKLVLICLLLVLPAAFSATCNNPLLAALDIDALGESADQTGLEYCQGLEGDNLCCSTATINTFQATINNLVISLIKQVAARDTYLLGLQEATVSSAMTTKLQSLQTKTTEALGAIDENDGETDPETNPDGRRLQAATSGLISIITPFATTIDDMTADYKTAKDNWTKYQQARAKCMNSLVEAQASIYCLACRADAEQAGVTVNDETYTVSLDSDFDTEVLGDCFEFIDYAQEQNQRIYYNVVMTKVDDLITKMEEIKAEPDTVTIAEVNAILAAGLESDTDKQIPSVGSCTSSDCDLITLGFFSAGILNQGTVANGGEVTAENASRMLASLRMLGGTYNPAAEENAAGVAVEFPEDAIAAAAAINGAWRQGGLMTCVVALVAMLLF